jgi:hypothetical protein
LLFDFSFHEFSLLLHLLVKFLPSLHFSIEFLLKKLYISWCFWFLYWRCLSFLFKDLVVFCF